MTQYWVKIACFWVKISSGFCVRRVVAAGEVKRVGSGHSPTQITYSIICFLSFGTQFLLFGLERWRLLSFTPYTKATHLSFLENKYITLSLSNYSKKKPAITAVPSNASATARLACRCHHGSCYGKHRGKYSALAANDSRTHAPSSQRVGGNNMSWVKSLETTWRHKYTRINSKTTWLELLT